MAVQEYVSRHHDVIVIDPLDSIMKLFDRHQQYNLVKHCLALDAGSSVLCVEIICHFFVSSEHIDGIGSPIQVVSSIFFLIRLPGCGQQGHAGNESLKVCCAIPYEECRPSWGCGPLQWMNLSSLPSHRASLPLDQYQIILHGDRRACVWITYPGFLRESTAPWPVSNYSAWWQTRMCVNNISGVFTWKRNSHYMYSIFWVLSSVPSPLCSRILQFLTASVGCHRLTSVAKVK